MTSQSAAEVARKYDAHGYRIIRRGQPTEMTGLRLDAYREIQMQGSGRKVEQALLRAKEGRG